MDEGWYRQVIEVSVPRLRVETCKLHLSGWDSVALEVNDALIFRFPRPNRPDVEEQLEKERALLPELANVLPLPIPQFAYIGDAPSGSGRRFVGYRKIDGVELRGDDLTMIEIEPIAHQLAEFLARLHAFPVERAVQLGLPAVSAADWRRQYEGLYRRVSERIFPLLEEPVRTQNAALWEGFLSNDDYFTFRPALIHRDLSSDHILYDAARGVIVGIIDWGDACIGDPAFDFVGLLGDYGPAFAEAALTHYEGEHDTTFWQRMRFYAAIAPVHEVLFGLKHGDETHIRRGLAMIKHTLARP